MKKIEVTSLIDYEKKRDEIDSKMYNKSLTLSGDERDISLYKCYFFDERSQEKIIELQKSEEEKFEKERHREEPLKLSLQAQAQKAFKSRTDDKAILARMVEKEVSKSKRKVSDKELKKIWEKVKKERDKKLREHPEYLSKKPLNFSLLINDGPEEDRWCNKFRTRCIT